MTTLVSEFLEVVKKSLGAREARILSEDEPPTASDAVLVCDLGTGQLLAVSFDEPPDPNSARRRLEMLVRAFASTLGATFSQPKEPDKERPLDEAIKALVAKSGALDALVIDAHSPAVWGSSYKPSSDVVESNETPELDNIYRIDGQPNNNLRSHLIERARELGVRACEALVLDPRAMGLIPKDVCERYRLVPLFGGNGGLLVSMADPTDLGAIYEVAFRSGLDIEPALASAKLIDYVLASAATTNTSTANDVGPSLEGEQKSTRESFATDVRDRWMRHFASQKAVNLVRAMPEVAALHRGRHLNRTIVESDFACVARSFAGIYVLIVLFRGAFDELRAKSAISQALPGIELLVLALPPRDPPPSIAGAKAVRRPILR